MERLTFDGNFCDVAQCLELPCPYNNNNCTQRQVWERLKQYEDSGLSPIACEEARKIEDGLSEHDYSIARMVELMQADKDGRVVVLPCKVGDTVWMYGEDFGTVLPYTIDLISLVDKVCGYSANCNHNGELLDGIDFEDGDIGKTVFLTREEAETALKEF